MQETRTQVWTRPFVCESRPPGSGLFRTDQWTCIGTALGSFAQSTIATDLFEEPLRGLSSRTLGDTCLQKFLVSLPGPDIPQAPSLERGCLGLGVGVGKDFSGSLSDHKSGLIAELLPTEAQCLPGRLSPGTRKLPEGYNCSLPCRDPASAAGCRGLTYSPGLHSPSTAAPEPNLRSSDPRSDSLKTPCAYSFIF